MVRQWDLKGKEISSHVCFCDSFDFLSLVLGGSSRFVWARTGLEAPAHLRLGQTVSKQVYSLNFVHSNSHFSIAFLLISTFAITRCLHQFRTHPTLAEVFQLHDSRCCLRQCAVLPMLASTGRIQRDAERSFWKALAHAPMIFFLQSCFFLS